MLRLADWESWNISSWTNKNDLSKPRRSRSEVHVKNMWIFHRNFTEFSHRFSHIISQRCEMICEIIMWNTCETGSTFSHSISQAMMWNTMWNGCDLWKTMWNHYVKLQTPWQRLKKYEYISNIMKYTYYWE